MKIRTGFVSNSSTTSFVLAFRKPVCCPHCNQTPIDFFEVIQFTFNSFKNDYSFAVRTAADLIETEQYNIDELEENNKWLSDKIKIYENFPSDEANKDMIDLVIQTVLNYDRNKRQRLIMEKNGGKAQCEDHQFHVNIEKHDRTSILTESIERMKQDLKHNQDKIKEKKAFIEKLRKYTDEEWNIFSAEIDTHDHYCRKIEDLIEKGTLEVIKKVTG